MTDGAGSQARTVRLSRRRLRGPHSRRRRSRDRRERGDERGGSLPHVPRPSGSADGARAGAGGHGEAGRGGAHERPSAESHSVGRRHPGDPRGLVPGNGGGTRGGRRRVRARESRRKAAGHVPAHRRSGADLLQPQIHRTAARSKKNTRRSTSTFRGRRCIRSVTASSYTQFTIQGLRMGATRSELPSR